MNPRNRFKRAEVRLMVSLLKEASAGLMARKHGGICRHIGASAHSAGSTATKLATRLRGWVSDNLDGHFFLDDWMRARGLPALNVLFHRLNWIDRMVEEMDRQLAASEDKVVEIEMNVPPITDDGVRELRQAFAPRAA